MILLLFLLQSIDCFRDNTFVLIEPSIIDVSKYIDELEFKYPNKTIIAYFQIHCNLNFHIISYFENKETLLIGYSDSRNIKSIKNIDFIISTLKKVNDTSKLEIVYFPEIDELIEMKYLWHWNVDYVFNASIDKVKDELSRYYMEKYGANRLIDISSYYNWCLMFLLDWGYEIEKDIYGIYFKSRDVNLNAWPQFTKSLFRRSNYFNIINELI